MHLLFTFVTIWLIHDEIHFSWLSIHMVWTACFDHNHTLDLVRCIIIFLCLIYIYIVPVFVSCTGLDPPLATDCHTQFLYVTHSFRSASGLSCFLQNPHWMVFSLASVFLILILILLLTRFQHAFWITLVCSCSLYLQYWAQLGILIKILSINFVPHCPHVADLCLFLTMTLPMSQSLPAQLLLDQACDPTSLLPELDTSMVYYQLYPCSSDTSALTFQPTVFAPWHLYLWISSADPISTSRMPRQELCKRPPLSSWALHTGMWHSFCHHRLANHGQKSPSILPGLYQVI